MAKQGQPAGDRFVPPIMHAFRSAFSKRDAERPLDLKDEAGERVIPGRRTSPRNSVNERLLREELVFDLSCLLNTVNFAACEDIDGLKRVKNSILNYGTADLTAVTADPGNGPAVAAGLGEVLTTFEARLVPGSLQVTPGPVSDDASGRIRFHISAEMYSTPANVPVEFVAEIENDTGNLRVSGR